MSLPPADHPETAHAPQLLDPPPPLDGFTREEFKARRDALRAAIPYGIILVRGTTGDEMHSGAGPFRQNANFFYLTGVDTPGGYLVLLPEDVPASAGQRDMKPEVREILLLPDRDATRETWDGANLGPGELAEKATGIERVISAGQLASSLTGWLRRNPILYTPAPFGEQAKLSRDYVLIEKIMGWAPVVQLHDCGRALSNLRTVKSTAEIERIREAIAITVEGQRAAQDVIADGNAKFEYEAEAAVFAAFRSRGGTCAFATIVGAGPRSTVLHYELNNGKMRLGDMVVVDIGARFGHYCGDLTRSYPVGGEFSARQKEIYALVAEAHKRMVGGFKPGEDSLKALTDRCKEFLRQSPMRGKDGKGKPQTMDHYMPHGLSHHLGLDVHDGGDAEAILAPGNVITIEPGVYVPAEGIGVRLEDDYLVTETGLERLGPPLEKNADIVQAAMTRQFQ